MTQLEYVPLKSRTKSFDSQTHWGVTAPARFQALMSEAKTLTAPGHYLSDNLFTWTRNNSVFEDGPFRKSLSASNLVFHYIET